MDYPKFIVSNQVEESISIQMVKTMKAGTMRTLTTILCPVPVNLGNQWPGHSLQYVTQSGYATGQEISNP